MAAPSASPADLRARLEELGREYARREAEHVDGMGQAQRCAECLRGWVAEAVEGFSAGARAGGAAHLAIEVSPTRLDDKHVRAVQFDVRRGRHVGIVTVKSRGDVTLVGPFHVGKKEGPCLSFPAVANDELRRALGDFLERFLQEAITP